MDLKLLKHQLDVLDAVNNSLHPSAAVGQLAEKQELKKSSNFGGITGLGCGL